MDPVDYLVGKAPDPPEDDSRVAWRAYAVALEQQALLADRNLRPTEAAGQVLPRVRRAFLSRFPGRTADADEYFPRPAQGAAAGHST